MSQPSRFQQAHVEDLEDIELEEYQDLGPVYAGSCPIPTDDPPSPAPTYATYDPACRRSNSVPSSPQVRAFAPLAPRPQTMTRWGRFCISQIEICCPFPRGTFFVVFCFWIGLATLIVYLGWGRGLEKGDAAQSSVEGRNIGMVASPQ
ncbi:hypothetical protein BKA64DRAFT_709662 [Cadophora sp. MPI-SDFR-AT-0126]|nr:hypothetical protein BKA64DRAFT_709662 [Leotiomycetes sp. MPI-SDFR-AT-0126]